MEVFFAAGHQQTGNDKWYRNVAYWLRQNTININNRLPENFYHGTCTNLWYLAIKQHGLMPRGMSGAGGSYGAQNISALSQANLVYLSIHPDAAAREASRQAAKTHGGQPLILKIDTKGLFPERLHPDEDTQNRRKEKITAQDSIRMAFIVGYQGRIGPSAIEPFLLGEEGVKNRTYVCKWVKFHDIPISEHPVTKKLKEKPLYILRGDAEYYALKDAGIIGEEDYDAPAGYKDKKVVLKKKDFTDEEIRNILNKSGWTQNMKAIIADLNEGYSGALYLLKEKRLPEDLSKEDQKIVDILLESGLVEKETRKKNWGSNPDEMITLLRLRETFFGHYEEQAIKLAKLLGKQDFRTFANKIKEMIDKWDAK